MFAQFLVRLRANHKTSHGENVSITMVDFVRDKVVTFVLICFGLGQGRVVRVCSRKQGWRTGQE